MIDALLLARSKVTPASFDDLRWLDRCQRQHSDAVGFLRMSDLEDLVRLECAAVVSAGDQMVGSLVWSGGRRKPSCLRQVCVPEDLWQRGLGSAACVWWLGEALSCGHPLARVRTRADLGRQIRINEVLGGQLVDQDAGGRRGYPVGLYEFAGAAPVLSEISGLLSHALLYRELSKAVGERVAYLGEL